MVKIFHPHGRAGPNFRSSYVFVERDEYLQTVIDRIKSRQFMVIHGYRGTGKSSLCMSLAAACTEEQLIPLYLDFTNVNLSATPDKFWLGMIRGVPGSGARGIRPVRGLS